MHGRPEELGDFFTDNMVIVDAGFQLLGEGKGTCVDSYISFCRQAEILEFRTQEYIIHVAGNSAVVSYSFEINYEMNHETFRDVGKEIFASHAIAADGRRTGGLKRKLQH